MRKEEHGLAESPKKGTGGRGTRVIAPNTSDFVFPRL